MNRKTNEAIVQAHLAAEARHDMEATLATLHPECLFVDTPLERRFEGRAGARAYYDLWWSAFNVAIEGNGLYWPREDLLIGEATFIGRHDGTFEGIAPTGRPVRLPIVVFVDFFDGLLAGERFVYDLNGLLRQIEQPAFAPVAS